MSSRLDIMGELEAMAKAANFKVGKLAQLCGITPRQVLRHVEKCHGLGAHVWLAGLRDKEAVHMLCEDCSVKEVALALGYTSAAHFCRAFKKDTGLTPLQFRQQRELYTCA